MSHGTLIGLLAMLAEDKPVDDAYAKDDFFSGAELLARRRLAQKALTIAQQRDFPVMDCGQLAAHVASALGALKGYGHADTAAAKSLQFVMDELMNAYNAPKRDIIEDLLKENVAEQLNEKSGYWYSCSGCHESGECGENSGSYPYSDTFKCHPGSGCHECGGIGVLWDDTDYSTLIVSDDDIEDGSANV